MNYYKNSGEQPTAKDSLLIENQHAITALRNKLEEQQQIHEKEMDELRTVIRKLRTAFNEWNQERQDLEDQINKQNFNPNKMYDGIQKI